MGNRIVLCVDDEETILNSLDMDLGSQEGAEYQLEIATGGLDAIELAQSLFEEGHELAVIISDHIMPEMKGDELLIKIHEDYPSAVKIMLTGQSQIDGVTNAINNAALYRYIEKPWQKEDLRLTVNTALKKFETERALLEKERIIREMNKQLSSNDGKSDEDTYRPEDSLSDEELYDQIYFSRYFQSLDSATKKWFALATIGLLNADNKLTKTEMNYLNTIVRSDREKEMVEYYIKLIKQKAKPNLKPLAIPPEERFKIANYLSHVVISSRRVKKEEDSYFRHICEQAGLESQNAGEFLTIINHKIEGNYKTAMLKNSICDVSAKIV